MNMKKVLNALFKEIIQHSEENPEFRSRLERALSATTKVAIDPVPPKNEGAHFKRHRNRRPAAILDPIHLARMGEDVLRTELRKLNIEQLRDIVAEYGMDTGKLVLKWRDAERVIDRIVELAQGRAQKGSAFRDQGPSDS
jgi:hypothetical protein